MSKSTNEPVAWISTGQARMIHWTSDKPAYGNDWIPLYPHPQDQKKDEALRLALEALKDIANETYDAWTNGAKAQPIAEKAITLIEQALENK